MDLVTVVVILATVITKRYELATDLQRRSARGRAIAVHRLQRAVV